MSTVSTPPPPAHTPFHAPRQLAWTKVCYSASVLLWASFVTAAAVFVHLGHGLGPIFGPGAATKVATLVYVIFAPAAVRLAQLHTQAVTAGLVRLEPSCVTIRLTAFRYLQASGHELIAVGGFAALGSVITPDYWVTVTELLVAGWFAKWGAQVVAANVRHDEREAEQNGPNDRSPPPGLWLPGSE